MVLGRGFGLRAESWGAENLRNVICCQISSHTEKFIVFAPVKYYQEVFSLLHTATTSSLKRNYVLNSHEQTELHAAV